MRCNYFPSIQDFEETFSCLECMVQLPPPPPPPQIFTTFHGSDHLLCELPIYHNQVLILHTSTLTMEAEYSYETLESANGVEIPDNYSIMLVTEFQWSFMWVKAKVCCMFSILPLAIVLSVFMYTVWATDLRYEFSGFEAVISTVTWPRISDYYT
jgi:hypothetical protein